MAPSQALYRVFDALFHHTKVTCLVWKDADERHGASVTFYIKKKGGAQHTLNTKFRK